MPDGNAPSEQPTGALAVVGEREGRPVSFQVLQDVYNELTGKSEELSKGYEIPFRITMEDLQQLHQRIKQLCEQYNVQSENESVTVYHDEDSREQFSSFDRFRLSDSSTLSPVESVFLKYNFLVILPKTKRPQSYSLSVRVASRMTVFRRLQQEMFSVPPVIRIMGGRTAMVSVQYVDYVVARSLLDGVDRWIKGLHSYEYPKWFKFVRRNSEYIRYAASYLLGGAAALLVLRLIPDYVQSSNPNFQLLMQFSLLSALGMFVFFRAGRFLGAEIERVIDEATELSYVKLNRGDEQRIAEAQRQNRWKIIRGVASGVVAIALGLLTSWLYERLAA